MKNQRHVVDFLSSPVAYTGHVEGDAGTVERRETHISIIFLVGSCAFKMKRAVRYPYLDFSTLDRRRHFCEREIEINTRTAPDIYQGVMAVTRDHEGALALNGDGEVVEWLVAMHRFDDTLLWDHLAESDALERRDFEVLADIVADFHAKAMVCLGGTAVAALKTTIDANEQSMMSHADGLFDPQAIETLIAKTRESYDAHRPRLNQRADAGNVRVCHGDLHLGNIFMEKRENGEDIPVLFDAIEFNEDFSHIDVFYDLAFLLMDVVYRVGKRRATALMNRYLDHMGDASGLPLLSLFISLRAAIRAHVSATAARQHADSDAAEKLRDHANRYFGMSATCFEPVSPYLVAVGGLSGSGKSSMARVVAGEMACMPGARVIRSDTMRKRLAGVAFDERLPPESYTMEASIETYAACMTEARRVLDVGFPVVLDAVFAKPEERQAAEALAGEFGVPFHGLWLEAPEQVMRERVESRRHNASDATAAVVRFQATYDLGDIQWHKVDSSGSKKQTEITGLRVLGLEPDGE